MAGIITGAMKNDFTNYFNTSKAGDATAWGGGMLTKNADGSANYSAPNAINGGTKIESNFGDNSLQSLADLNAGVADQWKSQYGYEVDPAAKAYAASVASKAPSLATHGGSAAENQAYFDANPNDPNRLYVQDWYAKNPGGIVGNAGAAGAAAGAGNTGTQPAATTSAAPNMQADWSKYWGSSTPGSSQAWANGTLTRNADGTATYLRQGDTGAGTVIAANADMGALAAANPDIAAAWKSQYGYTPAASPAAGAAGAAGQPPANTSWQVDPSKMTVQGQLKGILDPNNPLMQQAQTTGLQVAADRGMINSSMAQTGVQDAMLKSAVPIATADANMYGKSASENAGNAVSIANTGTNAATQLATNAASNATSLAMNTSNNATSIANNASSNATTLATNAANNAQSGANIKTQTEAAAALGIKDTQARQFIQGSASATTLMNNYTSQLASILKDPQYTTEDARTAASDHLLNSTKAGIMMVGALAGNADIAKYMAALFPEDAVGPPEGSERT
jgi:hypothetical protein